MEGILQFSAYSGCRIVVPFSKRPDAEMQQTGALPAAGTVSRSTFLGPPLLTYNAGGHDLIRVIQTYNPTLLQFANPVTSLTGTEQIQGSSLSRQNLETKRALRSCYDFSANGLSESEINIALRSWMMITVLLSHEICNPVSIVVLLTNENLYAYVARWDVSFGMRLALGGSYFMQSIITKKLHCRI